MACCHSFWFIFTFVEQSYNVYIYYNCPPNFQHLHLAVLLVFKSLFVRNPVSNGAHNSSCGFFSTSDKDWERQDEQIWNLFPTAQWTVFEIHLSFISRKSRNECSNASELAQRIFHRNWPGRFKSICCPCGYVTKLLPYLYFPIVKGRTRTNSEGLQSGVLISTTMFTFLK